jgi:hypothetical protein
MNTPHLQISMRKTIDKQYNEIQELRAAIKEIDNCYENYAAHSTDDINAANAEIEKLKNIIERAEDCLAMDLTSGYVVGVLNGSETKDKE